MDLYYPSSSSSSASTSTSTYGALQLPPTQHPPPPPHHHPRGKREGVRVVVDSRDRNVRTHPRPNDYVVALGEEVKNVARVDLLAANLPLTAYLVSPETNARVPYVIDADGSGTAQEARTAQLRTGNYDEAGLAEELQRALNASASDVVSDAFRVLYVNRLDRFEVYGRRAFTLAWRGPDETHPRDRQPRPTYAERSAGRLLGFGMQDVASTPVADPGADAPTTDHEHLVAAPYRKNFTGTDYVVMRLHASAVAAEAVLGTADSSDRSFALLVDGVRKGDRQSVTMASGVPGHVFAPPVPRVSRLHLSFVDHDGRPYDFQNHEHRLEFLFHAADS